MPILRRRIRDCARLTRFSNRVARCSLANKSVKQTRRYTSPSCVRQLNGDTSSITLSWRAAYL